MEATNYSDAALDDLTYTWDTNKNKKSESIGGVMSGYGFTNAGTTYDDEDRLTGYQRTNGALSQSWNLTSVGDWNSVTTNGTAQSRTHGPTHELLTAGGQTVNTDVKGNITLLPAALSSLASTALGMSWDFDNKLKSVDVGNNSSTDVEYKYDALGRRVARVGSSGSFVYVQSDQQTIADYGVGDAPSSPLYRYVYASYIDEPVVRKGAGTGGTIHYYHRNQQFSITAITTSSGTLAERYAYSAYGEPTILDSSGSQISISSISNRYSYTGREWDATVGLYHFRARWMSPKTGRFLTRDPIGYIDGFSLYRAYFVPSSVDPYGLHDPIFDPFRVKMRAELNRLNGMSPCLSGATGMSNLINNLLNLVDSVKIDLSTLQVLGLGGAASTQGTTILVNSINPNDMPVGILIHELVHVYDFTHDIHLRQKVGNWLYLAENLAYASEYLFGKLESLARMEDRFAKDESADCDQMQKDFDTTARMTPSYSIWVKGREHKPTMGNLVLASGELGVDFSCKNLLKCIKPHPCCELKCPENDVYSQVMEQLHQK